jgi:hypothetical protein
MSNCRENAQQNRVLSELGHANGLFRTLLEKRPHDLDYPYNSRDDRENENCPFNGLKSIFPLLLDISLFSKPSRRLGLVARYGAVNERPDHQVLKLGTDHLICGR